MSLSSESLASALSRRHRYFPRVDSTNDIAKAWLLEGAPDGAAVIADEQLRGRGRLGRTWHTPPNVALALSVILKPNASLAARINMIGALGVYDLCEQVGAADVGIKWPNDVQILGRKVSGILAESTWSGEQLFGIVLGIGVNVRADFQATALNNTAINLEDFSDSRLNRVELLRFLLERIDHWYERIASDEVFMLWKNRLNMLGHQVLVGDKEGRALDVTRDGALVAELEDGERREIHAGDVFVIEADRNFE